MTLHDRDSVTAAEARNRLSEVIDRAAIRKNRVIVTRRGKRVAALVPIEDVSRREELEERRERREFRAAKKEWEKDGRMSRSLKDVARSFGIKL